MKRIWRIKDQFETWRPAGAWRADSVTLALFACVTVGATWATRTQTLAGQGTPLLGAGAGGLAWACLYAGLGWALSKTAREEGRSPARVWRKVGLCLSLALASIYACKALVQLFLAPETWNSLFYLRLILPPVFVALWCAALLQRQAESLVRAVTTNRALVPVPQLAALILVAAVLVSFADIALEWSGGSAVETALKRQVIGKSAWTTNVLLLFSVYAFAFAITRRLGTSLLVISTCYGALALASLAKLKYMHSAVQPLDLIRIPELLPFLPGFFGTGPVVLAIAALGLWIAACALTLKVSPSQMSPARRWATAGFAIIVLSGMTLALSMVTNPSVKRTLRRLGAPGWEFRERARENGVLLSFLAEVRQAFVSMPSDYSPEAVAGAFHRYRAPPAAVPNRHHINLIVYLIESLMDPADLGLQYTSEPIPTIRGLRELYSGGHAIVPEEFGGSANTEFEVLTGMATCFLPRWSLPYRQYLRRPIPSLPRLLADLGYRTTAIQADPRHFFNRERAYDLLGFDDVVWLREFPGVQRADRGSWPSDQAVVDAIIRASQRAHPAFIFAFPSSTHSPYNRGTYHDSDLAVVDAGVSDTFGEVNEYINAVRVADRAVRSLVDHFAHQPDSTVIAILGDHLPPLSAQAFQPLFSLFSGASEHARFRVRRRVPLIVWSNFELAKEEKEFSVNALPSYLLARMNIPRSGIFAVSDEVRLKVPVLPGYLQNCGLGSNGSEELDPAQLSLLRDYRLLQYDLLLGKQYSRARISSAVKPEGTEPLARRRQGDPPELLGGDF